MYNRYIPQPDGSYRRSQMSSPAPQRRRPAATPPSPVKDEPRPCPPSEHPKPEHHPPEVCPPPRPSTGAGDFLRKLLPKDLDTGDLLIIILLLLMSADCPEEKNSALLTLALYLLM
ncbi:MAG: hypothetical protein E7439_06990 [Ruminococcaceae bacterium]|nr:hypothetical protein [Oscillospiraceae bacterium]